MNKSDAIFQLKKVKKTKKKQQNAGKITCTNKQARKINKRIFLKFEHFIWLSMSKLKNINAVFQIK